MKGLIRWLGVAALVGAGWWVWQRTAVTDEQRVQRALARLETAVEQRQWLRLEDGVAHDYADAFGFDKAGVLLAVRAFRAQYDAVFIHLSDVVITVAPDRQTAEAAFIAKVLGTPRGALAETEIRAERYRVRFRRTDQGWKLTAAETPALKFE
jgi:hypothetical protein